MSEGRIKHLGIAKNGEFKPYKPAIFRSELLQNDGQAIYVVVMPYVEAKSTDQLGFLHGGIIAGTCMKTEMYGGWTKDEIYSDFLQRFAETRVDKEIDGQIVEIRIRESPKDFSKKRMSEFIENILNFLALHDIYPLSPEEYISGKYKSVK